MNRAVDKNTVENHTDFRTGLINRAGIDQFQLNTYTREMRRYRDKFVAHLDSDEVAYPPNLQIGLDSVAYYQAHILDYDQNNSIFQGLPKDIAEYHDQCSREAAGIYQQKMGT